jgi:hypothetical protein
LLYETLSQFKSYGTETGKMANLGCYKLKVTSVVKIISFAGA